MFSVYNLQTTKFFQTNKKSHNRAINLFIDAVRLGYKRSIYYYNNDTVQMRRNINSRELPKTFIVAYETLKRIKNQGKNITFIDYLQLVGTLFIFVLQ